ncbi:hypothetical protein [Aquimarina sp. MMG016]|uniref:hypothetical protein n=1 Tax=Aquimarina sp. MMG016 TaxID=2822690 RepID=UPI001B39D536|nr:hypothetical protein [Aquimarina sp. MMG016]MBQ4822885.1 hypothetical protein [Aquimarina sp. MMG016]
MITLKEIENIQKVWRQGVVQIGTLKSDRSSYVNYDFSEDKGFALHPWTKVSFENASLILEENPALAIENYFFTDTNGQDTKVEYTFGYCKDSSGKLKIDVHHSSLTFNIKESV